MVRQIRRALHIGLVVAGIAISNFAAAQTAAVDSKVAAIEQQVIAWRRDIHQHPELSNRETRTAALVARHLQSLGIEVRTGVAKTGVVGVLKGAKPGRVIALRADMDALPVEEQTGLPFASKVTAEYNGKTVPVMHACGHDAHTAILMGAAQVLAGMRNQIPGTVVFIFQPAEEGPPIGEQGGASEMIKEGALSNPKPDAIFGLHVEPGVLGRIDVRYGPLLSSATDLRIDLQGRQTHGARPWEGTDLINLSADIVKSLTTLSARQVDVFDVPNVVTIGMMQAGVRGNILPGDATLQGTIRTFSEERLHRLQELIDTSVEGLAKSYGATAQVSYRQQAHVTGSDAKILESIMPALKEAAGAAGVDTRAPLRAAAEDFSFFEREIPGVYYIIGSTRDFKDKASTPSNHSPRFDIDERVLAIGVKAQVLTALQFLRTTP
ncbi:N-acyl-L-amino acid amidohydrolase [Steroidobacter agaridevorans]|uniref:N-acyl-L-amino acid amidohydrolase n=1 Tax=Steroidobacter agaridevorans TaxID=2695856 RepID=A0A829YER3_9GAMM|nr:amidohydrolase [Steroidobacter agaridevorans]GFE81774.1 N-acyl-L-amino acid amidohydrolase [Steroidobacter agaridevorans]